MRQTLHHTKKGAATPPPGKNQNSPIHTLSQKGMFSFAEVMIGSLIIALLIMAGVKTLSVTEKGTVNQKQREQALNLAKGRVEELKSLMLSQNWNNMQVDVRFPPVQTPVIASYNSYAPTTVTLGHNTFILDPEVRYMYSDATSLLQYYPTPGTAATPEVSDIVRIRVDCYYGDPKGFVTLPTLESQGIAPTNRMVYSNLISSHQINVTGTGDIWGYVYNGCPAGPPPTGVGGIQVGLYSGVQVVQSVLTDGTGYYQFNSIQAGIYTIGIISSPGYASAGACNFPGSVTLTGGTNIPNLQIAVTQIPVWNYYGVVIQATPVMTFVIPTSPTPTPNPTPPTTFPVANALVFANDGNSQPVSSNASGAYTITQVRSTPVAGHSYDVLEADNYPTTQSGLNYNVGDYMYPGSYVMAGATFIGPITICLNQSITNRASVTFALVDETGSQINGGTYYPMTLVVADGTASPPQTVISNPGAGNMIPLNVHSGLPNVQLNLSGNTSPPAYNTFNGTVSIGTVMAAPVTLVNYAVGSAAGTVCGMGANFDYTQFQVVATDDQGQFTYDIPVSYNGSATFGSFTYSYLRTPLGSPDNGHLNYNFTINASGNYDSTTGSMGVDQGKNNILDTCVQVTLLNVYLAVTVTQGTQAYPYGSWISAQYGTASAPPTTGMGSGFGVSSYYSSVTKGDGTATFPVQLVGGAATTYTVFSQIMDPTTYALTTKAATITVNTSNVFSSPKGVTFAF